METASLPKALNSSCNRTSSSSTNKLSKKFQRQPGSQKSPLYMPVLLHVTKMEKYLEDCLIFWTDTLTQHREFNVLINNMPITSTRQIPVSGPLANMSQRNDPNSSSSTFTSATLRPRDYQNTQRKHMYPLI